MTAVADTCAPDRPMWSVMLPAYRPNILLRDALLSVRASLDLARIDAQIEVVDDASPDVDVEALVSGWGVRGVEVHRRSANGGLGNCWNTCIDRSRGQLIHMLHQDDLVKPDFYESMARVAAANQRAGMIFCQTELLETSGPRLDALEQLAEGILEGDWLGRISRGQRLQCPSVVMRRDTYRRVGGFDPALRYVVDWEMWVRVAADFPVAYVPRPLAVYRIHAGAETRQIKSAGVVAKDMFAALGRVKTTLKKAGRSDCVAAATAYAANVAWAAVYEAHLANEKDIAAKEFWATMCCFGPVMGPKWMYWQTRRFVRDRRRLAH
jgi:glycosyltransferase involved in cell wall biosynthesis